MGLHSVDDIFNLFGTGNITIGSTTDSTTGGFTSTRFSIKQIADGSYGGGLHIEQNSNTNVAYFGFNGSAFRIGTSYRTTGSYQPIHFVTTNSVVLHLGTDGNVGIGTTAPVLGSKLNIYGSGIWDGACLTLTNTGTSGRSWTIFSTNSSFTQGAGKLLFYNTTGSNDAGAIDSSNNWGIGTASPGQRLHVEGRTLINMGTGASTFDDLNIGGISGWSNGEAHRINFVYGTAASPSIFTTIESKYNGGKAELRFRNMFNGGGSSATMMTIVGGTGVGIGTESPSYAFQVNKTATATPAMMIGGAFYGGPRLQVYGLDADANAWMGLGTDMAGNAYEHSIYYSDTGSNGILVFCTYNGTTVTQRASLSRTGALSVTGNITAYSSDVRIKKNIKNIDNALQKLLSINGVTFNWDLEECNKWDFYPTTGIDVGVIAQEVQAVLPEVVEHAPFDKNGDKDPNPSKSGKNYLTVNYEKLVPLLIEAIKEQQKQIEELKSLINNKH
jgi:hypothetical protein